MSITYVPYTVTRHQQQNLITDKHGTPHNYAKFNQNGL